MAIRLGGLMSHHNNAAHELSRHQKSQGKTIQSLSTGKRVHSAADDAARLARSTGEHNRVRANVQAKRNAQDALSLVQTSSNAMSHMQNVLTRLRSLALQASNEGALQDQERAYLQQEFTALVGQLDELTSSTTYGSTGLIDKPRVQSPVPFIDDFLTQGVMSGHSSGLNSFGIIPQGTQNLVLELNSFGMDDDLQITTRSGQHLVGTPLTDGTWTSNSVTSGNIDTLLITKNNGYLDSASYNGAGLHSPAYNYGSPSTISYNGMTIGYSGESQPASNFEKITIDNATEDLIITITGTGSFQLTPNWTSIPPLAQRTAGLDPQTLTFQIGEDGSALSQIEIELMDLQAQSLGLDTLDISTVGGAQAAITALDSTMKTVEGHQAKYGAYENTIGRAMEQAETRRLQESANLSVSEDADFAEVSTELARTQIQSNTITTSLKSADYLKELYVTLIQQG